MSILKNSSTRIKALTFDSSIHIHLTSEDILVVPLNYTAKLAKASKKDLVEYRLIGGGIGVHFEGIDEDISLSGIIHYKMTHELMAS